MQYVPIASISRTKPLPGETAASCSRNLRWGTREKSELKLHAELHRTRSVGAYRVKEAVTYPAAGCPRRESRALVTVATDGVAGGVALVRIVKDELRVVEEVECLQTKLQKPLLTAEGQVLEQGNVEVGAAGIIEGVAAGGALREAARSHKHARIT